MDSDDAVRSVRRLSFQHVVQRCEILCQLKRLSPQYGDLFFYGGNVLVMGHIAMIAKIHL
jgi:hypothetical protein